MKRYNTLPTHVAVFGTDGRLEPGVWGDASAEPEGPGIVSLPPSEDAVRGPQCPQRLTLPYPEA